MFEIENDHKDIRGKLVMLDLQDVFRQPSQTKKFENNQLQFRFRKGWSSSTGPLHTRLFSRSSWRNGRRRRQTSSVEMRTLFVLLVFEMAGTRESNRRLVRTKRAKRANRDNARLAIRLSITAVGFYGS